MTNSILPLSPSSPQDVSYLARLNNLADGAPIVPGHFVNSKLVVNIINEPVIEFEMIVK